MSAIKDLIARGKRKPTDVVALDFGSTGIKAVRLRRAGDAVSVVDARILPHIALEDNPQAESATEVSQMSLAAELGAKHVTCCFSSSHNIIKLLNFPGEFDDNAAGQVGKHLGLEPEQEEVYRIGVKVVGTGKNDTRVLAVAMPNTLASTVAGFFPIGVPAPVNIEISGLSAVLSFSTSSGVKLDDASTALLDFGATQSIYSLIHKGNLALTRKFDFGLAQVIEKVSKSLGVDSETAIGIIKDGSFDISQPVGEVMEPFIKQLIISRDFVERRENCQISTLFVSGAATPTSAWLKHLESTMALEVKTWNPFEGMTDENGALNDELMQEAPRYASAVGSALGVFEEE